MDRAEALALILGIANRADAVVGDAQEGVNWPETIKGAFSFDELEHRLEDQLVEAISVLTGLPQEKIFYSEAAGHSLLGPCPECGAAYDMKTGGCEHRGPMGSGPGDPGVPG